MDFEVPNARIRIHEFSQISKCCFNVVAEYLLALWTITKIWTSDLAIVSRLGLHGQKLPMWVNQTLKDPSK